MRVQILPGRISTPASFLILLVLFGCGGGSSGGASSSAQAVAGLANLGETCTYSEIDAIPVGQDPTQNFTATNVTETDEIQGNTCGGLANGVLGVSVDSSISRSGNVITSVSASGSDPITISGNQATVSQSDLNSCTNGIQSTGTFTGIELDPLGGYIRIYSNWKLVVNGCTTATPSTAQSALATVITDYLSPSDTTSQYLISVTNAVNAEGTANFSYNQSQCTFAASGAATAGSSIAVSCTGSGISTVTFSFQFPSALVPGVGKYSTLETPSNPNAPVIMYSIGASQSDSTNKYGYVNITDLQFDLTGKVSSFAAHFEFISNASEWDPTYGTIRYNSVM